MFLKGSENGSRHLGIRLDQRCAQPMLIQDPRQLLGCGPSGNVVNHGAAAHQVHFDGRHAVEWLDQLLDQLAMSVYVGR